MRKGKGESDVSGDRTVYAKKAAYRFSGITATLKGNGVTPTLITWSYKGYSYSLSCSICMDKNYALNAMRHLSGIKETRKQ